MNESMSLPAGFDFDDPADPALIPLGGPGPGDPTPGEIARRAAEVRAGWSAWRWSWYRVPGRLEMRAPSEGLAMAWGRRESGRG
jgi:hypothetical protein